jgi:uncharacterized protein YheU (UPF0270 family)
MNGTDSTNEVRIYNKRIYDYYCNNRENFEALILLFIDFFEKMNGELNSALTRTINEEILNEVKELKSSVERVEGKMVTRFQEISKEYVENVRMILLSVTREGTDKVVGQLEKNMENYVAKWSAELPKSEERMSRGMKEQLEVLQGRWIEEMKKEAGKEMFLKDMDVKLEPLYSLIKVKQEQIASSLTNMREMNIASQVHHSKVMENLGEFLNKYRTNSAYKGQSSENMLLGLLNKMYPSDEVVDSRSLKESGDFMLRRMGKRVIMLENKNYDLNVNVDEVKKFLRDIKAQKCSGIFMSQHSGIVGKTDYYIEIDGENVLIYLHNVDYCAEKIKTAIEMIDHLTEKLEEVSRSGGGGGGEGEGGGSSGGGAMIRKEVLDKINEEFKVFATKKEAMGSTVKEFQKRMLMQIEEMQMPNLSDYLNTKYASIENTEYMCPVCQECFTTKVGLSIHKKKKHKNSA